MPLVVLALNIFLLHSFFYIFNMGLFILFFFFCCFFFFFCCCCCQHSFHVQPLLPKSWCGRLFMYSTSWINLSKKPFGVSFKDDSTMFMLMLCSLTNTMQPSLLWYYVGTLTREQAYLFKSLELISQILMLFRLPSKRQWLFWIWPSLFICWWSFFYIFDVGLSTISFLFLVPNTLHCLQLPALRGCHVADLCI